MAFFKKGAGELPLFDYEVSSKTRQRRVLSDYTDSPPPNRRYDQERIYTNFG